MTSIDFPRQFTLVRNWVEQPPNDPLADLLEMEQRCANWCVPELLDNARADGVNGELPYTDDIASDDASEAKKWANRLILVASHGTREIRSWSDVQDYTTPLRAVVYSVDHTLTCDLEESTYHIRLIDNQDAEVYLDRIARRDGLIFVKYNAYQTPGSGSTSDDDVYIHAADIRRIVHMRRKTEIPTY